MTGAWSRAGLSGCIALTIVVMLLLGVGASRGGTTTLLFGLILAWSSWVTSIVHLERSGSPQDCPTTRVYALAIASCAVTLVGHFVGRAINDQVILHSANLLPPASFGASYLWWTVHTEDRSAGLRLHQVLDRAERDRTLRAQSRQSTRERLRSNSFHVTELLYALLPPDELLARVANLEHGDAFLRALRQDTAPIELASELAQLVERQYGDYTELLRLLEEAAPASIDLITRVDPLTGQASPPADLR
ncbi:MAG: hypothetical protein KTR31_09055 [Myxococcales bacterium]|nr:hypothetical protein [Myxococcales bacterium]